MKLSIKTLAALAVLGLSFGTVASLSAPANTSGFNLLGGELGVAQRDFRVFNNFTDASANNNNTPHANFPGATGAVMSIWKGHVEWASEPYAGNGSGDPVSGNVLGSGLANFDNIYQGEASNAGGFNDNVHAELIDTNPGSTLAFMQGPISDGWTIKYLSFWQWQDGPGTIGSGGGLNFDIQNIATHEIGHSLGLDHSGSGSATMAPSASAGSESERSITTDDRNGIQAVYGAVSGSKPRITSLSGSTNIGGVLTIHGSGFLAENNVAWFTKVDSDGVPAKVNMLASTNGGTRIDLTIPAGVQDGEIMIKIPMTGHDSLTNAFPIDVGDPIAALPVVDSVSPNTGAGSGFTPVTITGEDFTGATSVTFGGSPALSFVVDSATQISAVSPPGTPLSNVTVTVTTPNGSGSKPNAFFYGFDPTPVVDTITPDVGPLAGGTTVTISGTTVVGVTEVRFDGVAGTGLSINSGTELEVTTPPGAMSGPVDVVVDGNGIDSLAGGFEYEGGGEFVDLGFSLAGAGGAPVFTGSGDLTPGSGVGYSTTLSNAAPGVLGFLFIGLVESTQPFKGGTIVPFPFLLSVQTTIPGSGMLSLPSTIDPATPSAAEIIAQWWIADPTGPSGATASNGLKLVVP
ncbi:MAG: hypothetical protein DHS20C15_17680 [Planctomycetota bacterium]|nr:MAG: hypothetical protein DHS20C15_17680 [Planctomycetota bacterium]